MQNKKKKQIAVIPRSSCKKNGGFLHTRLYILLNKFLILYTVDLEIIRMFKFSRMYEFEIFHEAENSRIFIFLQ